MQEWTTYLGQFHPLLVHMPIGILMGVFLLELLQLIKKEMLWTDAIIWLLGFAALTGLLTLATGWWLFETGGYGGRADLVRHTWFGVGTGALTVLAWFLKCKSRKKGHKKMHSLYRFNLLVLFGVLCWTSHLGGTFTHGEIFTKNFPLQLAMSEEEESKPDVPEPVAQTSAPVDEAAPAEPVYVPPADPTVYSALLRPVFQKHCVQCHGPEKAKNRLRMDTPEGLKAGGKNGPLFITGDAENSLLIQRITLPEDDIDLMPPPEEEIPLSPEQIQFLTWWVASGISLDTPMSQVELPEEFQTLLP